MRLVITTFFEPTVYCLLLALFSNLTQEQEPEDSSYTSSADTDKEDDIFFGTKSNPKVVVNTPLGKITGKHFLVNRHRGSEVAGFLGIPYAQPPVEDLRFRVSKLLYTLIDC